MEDFSSNNSSFFNKLNLKNTSQEINTHLSNLDIENINNNRNHYLCCKCFNFPYIKFCKDRKHIRLTCSCLIIKRF